MPEAFEAYRSTKLRPDESQADIRELLRARKATGLSIAESWLGDHPVAELRFALPIDGGFLGYRIRVAVPAPDTSPRERVVNQHSVKSIPRTPAEIREEAARLERQIWRLLFWWLKAQFEAAEAGLVSIEEAMLPWMELPDGCTAYETVQPGLAQIAAGTAPLMLGKGGR